MKILVVYYSRSGNTKRVAIAIANALKCDIEEIIDTKNRSGILGWFSAGRDGSKKSLTKIKDLSKDIRAYDHIIVGGPIWAWNLCSPVRTFLMQNIDQINSASFFCSEGGKGSDNAFKSMEDIIGRSPVASLAIKEAELKSGNYTSKVAGFVDSIRKA